jgi:hypothetical protein
MEEMVVYMFSKCFTNILLVTSIFRLSKFEVLKYYYKAINSGVFLNFLLSTPSELKLGDS